MMMLRKLNTNVYAHLFRQITRVCNCNGRDEKTKKNGGKSKCLFGSSWSAINEVKKTLFPRVSCMQLLVQSFDCRILAG